ncbi:transporter substrate-binding domain-containing protein [Hydrogenovibrio sp. JE_KL2]|uniref:transporter substrate-binding domain-containing protein n=1 Tax=Hydrogenovibrio sp. JE_KL2 TaxID=2651188 RepID=UPI00128B04C6|nr:transporter substrate-binding domain-containing protein [Hydrogenovibrio sp. JE_KL2]MPQ76476.1 transporter substrate-binding domain-containing protein [Hydrogenovibrio sp. JE_KL2]
MSLRQLHNLKASLFVWLFLLSFHAQAALQLSPKEKHWIKEHPVVHLGGDFNWPPFEFADAKKEHAGIAADILKEIAKRTGLTIRVKTGIWSDILAQAKAGQLDGLSCAVKTQQREAYFTFTTPYTTMPLALVVSTNSSIRNLKQLNGKTLALNGASYLEEWIRKHYPQIHVVPMHSNKQALEAVSTQQVDAYAGNIAVATYLIKKSFLTNISIVSQISGYQTNTSIAISKKLPILASIMQKALDDIPQIDKNAILNKWFIASSEYQFTAKEQQWMANHPVIKVAGETDWAPFDFTGSQGDYKGIANDYLNVISKKTGLRFKIQTGSWQHNLSLLREKKVDLLPAANKTEDRLKFALFSRPYFKTLNYFFIRNDLKAKTLNDLNGKVLAIPKDYASIKLLKKKFPRIQLLQTDNLNQALDAVIQNKAQILYDTYSVLSFKLAQEGISTIHPFASTRDEPQTLHFMVRKDAPELVSIINKALNDMLPIEKKHIFDQWLSKPEDQTVFNLKALKLSDAETAWLSRHSSITFAGDPNWLPYEAFNKEGKYIGIVADNLKAIEHKIPLKIQPKHVTSWQQTLKLSEHKSVDIISGDMDDAILRKNYHPITPYMSSPIVIVMDDKTQFINSLTELKNQRVALVKGYGYTNAIYKDFPDQNFIEVNTPDEALEGVGIGKFDAAILSLPKASYLIKQKGLNTLKIVGKTPVDMKLTLFVKKGEPELFSLLNKVMKNVTAESGSKILNNWTKIEFASKVDYWMVIRIIAIFLAIIGFIIYWNLKLSKEITQRKLAEDHLQIEKENFQNLFETSADAHLIIQNRQFISCNHAALELLGLESKQQLLGTTPMDWSPEYQPDTISSEDKINYTLRECFNRGTIRLDWMMRKQNGEEFWVDVVLTVIQYQGHPAIYVSWRDQTEQKNLEASIKRNQEQVQAIIDSVPLIIKVTDYDGNLLSANQKAKKDYLIDVDNPTTQRMKNYYSRPEEQKEIEDLLNTHGKIEQRIVPMKDINGNDVQMMLSILPIHYANRLALLSIYVDLSDRIHMEQQLNEAKELAESANQAKTEFLANMSHEIRTPMNAIIGFTELLNDQIKEPRLKSFIRTIQSAGNTLLMLINDILDLSKIEAGKMTLHKQATNPTDLFQEIADIFSMNVQQKGLDLFMDVAPDLPEAILLDSVRLRQVLFNLLGNAVKFTDSGYIKLSVRAINLDQPRSKLDLLIEVKDTGIGIPEAEQSRIFNVFEQQSGQDNRKFGGTGLGLSITKRLVEMMEGEIQVESKAGKGSTFKILLHQMDIASTHSPQYMATHRNLNNINFRFGRILVVDDIADNRELIAQNFIDTEVQITQAQNGQEALDKAMAEDFDLILMDIRMPVMDGYEAAQRIKAEKPAIPVIALTASVMQDEFEKAKRAHFDGYLRKPVLKNDLFNMLCQYLAYDEIEVDDAEVKQPLTLSDTARSRLQDLNAALEDQLEPKHQRAVKTNNLEDFEAFAENAKEVGELFDVPELINFSSQLKEKVDSFDIGGMQQMLKQFGLLSSELSNLIQQTTANRSRR